MTERKTYTITRLGMRGDGIADGPDGPLYLPGTLPGELVSVGGGEPARIEHPSPQRRHGYLCPHAPGCGGCAQQHLSEDFYRQWKATLVGEALKAHGIAADVRPMLSAPAGSRRRAVLTARRDGQRIELGFHRGQSHDIEPLEACAVLAPAIVSALPGLRAMALIALTSKSEARLSVVATPHGLDVDIAGARREISADQRTAMVQTATGHRIARLSLDGTPMLTRARPALVMAGVEVIPPPGAFLQAAVEAEGAMTAIAVEAAGKAKRVADLFSGLGTFSFALARRARVLAIDTDRALVDALAAAARGAAGLKPIETKVRDLMRDPLSPRELEGFDAVLFDPPRSGARAQAEALAGSKVRTVVAVSCNPATLARDLEILLAGGYRIEAVTPIDQFLYTAHIEAIAVLRR